MVGKKKTGPKPKLLDLAVATNRQRARLATEESKTVLQAVIVTERSMGVDHYRLARTNVLAHQLPTLQRMREHHDATHTYVEGEVICVFDPTLKPSMWLGVVRGIKHSKGMHKNPRGAADNAPAAPGAAPGVVAAAGPAADPTAAPAAPVAPAAAQAAAAAAPTGAVAVAPDGAATDSAAADSAAAMRARNASRVRVFRNKGIDPADPSTHISRPGEQQPVIVYACDGKLVHRTCSVLYCATLEAVVASNFAEGEVAPLGRYDTPNPDGTYFKGELTLAQLANALLPPDSGDIDSQYTEAELQELRDRVAGYVIWESEAVASNAPVPPAPPAPPSPSSPHPSSQDGI
jgi:hypothetical protein